MVVARFVNWFETLAELVIPCRLTRSVFSPSCTRARSVAKFASVLRTISRMAAAPLQSRNTSCSWCSHRYGDHSTRKRLRPRDDDSLLSFYGRLREANGLGSFMAAQVVADVKYAQLKNARDWSTFVAPGPGSKRGLNRVLGRPVDAPWRDDDTWRAAFRKLHEQIKPELERIGLGDLHAQDLQNCLCEMDKYERARLGEGKPKRRFVPRDR